MSDDALLGAVALELDFPGAVGVPRQPNSRELAARSLPVGEGRPGVEPRGAARVSLAGEPGEERLHDEQQGDDGHRVAGQA